MSLASWTHKSKKGDKKKKRSSSHKQRDGPSDDGCTPPQPAAGLSPPSSAAGDGIAPRRKLLSGSAIQLASADTSPVQMRPVPRLQGTVRAAPAAGSATCLLTLSVHELRNFNTSLVKQGFVFVHCTFAHESGADSEHSKRTLLRRRTRAARVSHDGHAQWFETFVFRLPVASLLTLSAPASPPHLARRYQSRHHSAGFRVPAARPSKPSASGLHSPFSLPAISSLLGASAQCTPPPPLSPSPPAAGNLSLISASFSSPAFSSSSSSSSISSSISASASSSSSFHRPNSPGSPSPLRPRTGSIERTGSFERPRTGSIERPRTNSIGSSPLVDSAVDLLDFAPGDRLVLLLFAATRDRGESNTYILASELVLEPPPLKPFADQGAWEELPISLQAEALLRTASQHSHVGQLHMFAHRAPEDTLAPVPSADEPPDGSDDPAHKGESARRRRQILSCPVPGSKKKPAVAWLPNWNRASPSNRHQLREEGTTRLQLGVNRSTRLRALTTDALPSQPLVAVEPTSLSMSSIWQQTASPARFDEALLSPSPKITIEAPAQRHAALVQQLHSLTDEELAALGLQRVTDRQPTDHSNAAPTAAVFVDTATASPSPPLNDDDDDDDDDDMFDGLDAGYQQETLDDSAFEQLSTAAAATSQQQQQRQRPVASSVRFSVRDYRTDWNGRYQSIIRRINDLWNADINDDALAETTRTQAQNDLIHLAQDFLFFVRHYGKTIIAEVSLPVDEKTIKPTSMGGKIGGEKFLVRNILFKFAGNFFKDQGLLSEAHSAKIASHDLKGLQCFLNCRIHLCYPFMAILDYLGHRLVAMAVLPISPETIVHGSADAGQTVHICQDPKLVRVLRRAASILNIRPHMQLSPNQPIFSSSSPLAAQQAASTSPSSSLSHSPGNQSSHSPGRQSSNQSSHSPGRQSVAQSSNHSSSQSSTASSHSPGRQSSHQSTSSMGRQSSSLSGSPSPQQFSDQSAGRCSSSNHTPPKSSTSSSLLSDFGDCSDSCFDSASSYSSYNGREPDWPLSRPAASPSCDSVNTSSSSSSSSSSSRRPVIPGMYFATDIECHRGWDGRLYLVDFSRVLPPVTPRDRQKFSYLYELFRPEFIKKYKTPLCSDAYSGFLKRQDDAEWAKRDVDTATAYLLDTLIPRVAAALPDKIADVSLDDCGVVTELLHRKGVGMRYLGLIFGHLLRLVDANQASTTAVDDDAQPSDWQQRSEVAVALVAVEIYARGFVSVIRHLLRQKTSADRSPILSEHRRIIVSYLNLLFGESKASQQFWQGDFRGILVDKFHGLAAALPALHQDVFIESPHLPVRGRLLLFRRIAPKLGLKMVPEFAETLGARLYNQERPVSQADLEELCESVKTVSVVDHAYGYVSMYRGLLKRSTDPQSAIACFEAAIVRFEHALRTSRNDKYVLRDLARALEYLEDEKARETGCMGFGATPLFQSPRIELANRYYLKAIALDPEDPRSLLYYAKFLERFGQRTAAEEFYLRSLEVGRDFIPALLAYGTFLASDGNDDAACEFFTRAKDLSAGRNVQPLSKFDRSRELRLSDS